MGITLPCISPIYIRRMGGVSKSVSRCASFGLTVLALVNGGCSTVPADPRSWHDSDQSRGDIAADPGISVCSAAYTEAFERAKGDYPAAPAPGPSGSAMATQAAATVNVWRSMANDAFNKCMRSRSKTG